MSEASRGASAYQANKGRGVGTRSAANHFRTVHGKGSTFRSYNKRTGVIRGKTARGKTTTLTIAKKNRAKFR